MLLSKRLYGVVTAACATACPTKKMNVTVQHAPPKTTSRVSAAGNCSEIGSGRFRVVVDFTGMAGARPPVSQQEARRARVPGLLAVSPPVARGDAAAVSGF